LRVRRDDEARCDLVGTDTLAVGPNGGSEESRPEISGREISGPAQAPVLVDEPAQSDGFVRGLAEVIGGPLGQHAVRPPRSVHGGRRFWTPVRVVLALTCLMLSMHWVQKSPCRDGAWVELSQYKYFCYTDVLALYPAEGLGNGDVPYRDHAVEYPVLTGALMGVLGLPVHDYAQAHPGFNEVERFYDLNALVLGAMGVATAAMILAVRQRRPWDAALFGLSPALFVSATVNWDLLALGLTAFFLYAWARRRPGLAGVLFGLAVSAKFYPVLLVGPLLVLALRANRWRAVAACLGAGAATWLAVNLPVWIGYRDSWLEFWHLSRVRGIDWGTLWYIGEHLPHLDGKYGIAWFAHLDQEPNHATLNMLYFGLFAVACLAIGVLGMLAPRRPRLAQLAFLVVAAFLVVGKVWSQQYVLWLLPLAVLARPRWGAFLAWQVAELAYFLAFDGEQMGALGRDVLPEWAYVLASILRLVTLCVLMGYVVRDIVRPERDVVRASYPDDPDGGDFDGAPDGHIARLLRDRVVPRPHRVDLIKT
jgi:uncharacterized membrane protein